MTIFFYGPNTYELRRQLNQMMESYRSKTGSDLGLERVDGAAVSLAALGAALTATPFLASSRLVVVEGLCANKTLAPKLPGLLAQVPASTVAVFVDPGADQRTVAFKALKQADKVVKFEPLTGPKLTSWVRAEAQRCGGSIAPQVAQELIARAGEDQWRLSNEIAKLVSYEAEVSLPAVRDLVDQTIERSIFEMVEAMTAGKADVALVGYRSLLRQKQGEIYVLTMVQWQLRNLLLLKLAPAAMSPSEVAAETGISPYVSGKAAAVAGGIGEAGLRQAFEAAVDCEYRIKSGYVKAELGVEQLIWRVTQLLRT